MNGSHHLLLYCVYKLLRELSKQHIRLPEEGRICTEYLEQWTTPWTPKFTISTSWDFCALSFFSAWCTLACTLHGTMTRSIGSLQHRATRVQKFGRRCVRKTISRDRSWSTYRLTTRTLYKAEDCYNSETHPRRLVSRVCTRFYAHISTALHYQWTSTIQMYCVEMRNSNN